MTTTVANTAATTPRRLQLRLHQATAADTAAATRTRRRRTQPRELQVRRLRAAADSPLPRFPRALASRTAKTNKTLILFIVLILPINLSTICYYMYNESLSLFNRTYRYNYAPAENNQTADRFDCRRRLSSKFPYFLGNFQSDFYHTITRITNIRALHILLCFTKPLD